MRLVAIFSTVKWVLFYLYFFPFDFRANIGKFLFVSWWIGHFDRTKLIAMLLNISALEFPFVQSASINDLLMWIAIV